VHDALLRPPKDVITLPHPGGLGFINKDRERELC